MWGSRARLALTCGVEALGTWRLALITHRGDLSCLVVVRNAGRCSLNSRLYSEQTIDPAKCRLHKGKTFSRLINFFHHDPNEIEQELRASLQLASDVKCRPGEVNEAKRSLQSLRRPIRAMAGVRRERAFNIIAIGPSGACQPSCITLQGIRSRVCKMCRAGWLLRQI